jgi:membrane associated rhomboid family serine protease
LEGGERQPMMNNSLRRNPAKNDKRKTAKAVTPLRSMENLFLLCRNLTSTCGVESPLVLARIFLTGYPSLYIVYENRNCYLQAIKIPPNLKQVWRVFVKSFGHSNTAHQIAVFFIWWTYLPMVL